MSPDPFSLGGSAMMSTPNRTDSVNSGLGSSISNASSSEDLFNFGMTNTPTTSIASVSKNTPAETVKEEMNNTSDDIFGFDMMSSGGRKEQTQTEVQTESKGLDDLDSFFGGVGLESTTAQSSSSAPQSHLENTVAMSVSTSEQEYVQRTESDEVNVNQSVIINDIGSDLQGPTETEDYASAKALYEERRREQVGADFMNQQTAIRNQQQMYEEYERNHSSQQEEQKPGTLQDRFQQMRERGNSFLNNNVTLKNMNKMKNSFFSNAKEKINNLKASRSGMSEQQQQQLQTRDDYGPKITQVAPSPNPSPRQVLVEGSPDGSTDFDFQETSVMQSRNSRANSKDKSLRVSVSDSSLNSSGGLEDILGVGGEGDGKKAVSVEESVSLETQDYTKQQSTVQQNSLNDTFDIFAQETSEPSISKPAAGTSDIDALFAEPAAPAPASAPNTGFDDIFGNNGVQSTGPASGGGISFGDDLSGAGNVAVDSNNNVLVEDEAGEAGEPEIRKRLREQRIQKKKAAIAAALQEKKDKDMMEAMERAEVRYSFV